MVLDPEESISKIIIRAILRKIGVDVDLWNEYSLQRCHCKAQGGQDRGRKQLEGLGVAQGGSLFIQKIEKRTKRARILSAVHICYDPSHQPFATEGAVRIEDLDSERSASKIIRAVIRSNGIGAASWENYSLHRCYCNAHTKIKDRRNEALKSDLTLKELEIRDGESVFIRKTDGREMEEGQGSNSSRPSRKRKERADNASLHSQSRKISPATSPTSRKIKLTSSPSNVPAAVGKVSSNLENLPSNAGRAERSISKLLGGDGWKNQSIGNLGFIQTRGEHQLVGLCSLVKQSLEIEQDSAPEPGLFNSDLVEALTRAYHERISTATTQRNHHFFVLGLSDYVRADELLRGKVNQDGSWERSSLSHLDESSLSNPISRFSLSNSGLSGRPLRAARDVCILWNNEKWMNQPPIPGVSPIGLKNTSINALLRQIADLTRVKPGEATPDGFPLIVLDALKESIQEIESTSSFSSPYGWAQSKAIPLALEILKRAPGAKDSTSSSSPSIASGSGKKKRRIVARAKVENDP